jgi:guanine nucleotide-binding protein G(i) subunit alpha
MIQWLRLLFYIKLFRKGPEEQPTEEDYIIAAAAMRSEAIDRALEEDATYLRRETKLVLMGSPQCGKELIMRQMKVLYADGFPREERIQITWAIRSTARLLIHSIIDLLKDTGVNLPFDLNNSFAVLLDEVEKADMNTITPAAVHAVDHLWNSPNFSELFIKNFEIDFPQYATYFARELGRIAEPDYVPTEADIVRLNQCLSGVTELRFDWDELQVHLFNIGDYIPFQFQKRWFHQLEGATAVIVTVDVSIYDRPFLGKPNESQLLADIHNFETYVNSPMFANTSIILLLNNFTRFREKLQHSPLETFFPDYQPPGRTSTTPSPTLTATNPPPSSPLSSAAESSARQYVLRRFKEVNRNRLSIYSFWVDLDTSDNQHLYAALKKTLQHIQQRKARSEVWDASTSGASSRRATVGRSTPAKSRSSRVKGSTSSAGLISGTGTITSGLSSPT